MMSFVPKEIREATMEVSKWETYFPDKKCFGMREDTPEEIKKLKKKVDDWNKKNLITDDMFNSYKE